MTAHVVTQKLCHNPSVGYTSTHFTQFPERGMPPHCTWRTQGWSITSRSPQQLIWSNYHIWPCKLWNLPPHKGCVATMSIMDHLVPVCQQGWLWETALRQGVIKCTRNFRNIYDICGRMITHLCSALTRTSWSCVSPQPHIKSSQDDTFLQFSDVKKPLMWIGWMRKRSKITAIELD